VTECQKFVHTGFEGSGSGEVIVKINRALGRSDASRIVAAIREAGNRTSSLLLSRCRLSG
jgi:hypothetical protein